MIMFYLSWKIYLFARPLGTILKPHFLVGFFVEFGFIKVVRRTTNILKSGDLLTVIIYIPLTILKI